MELFLTGSANLVYAMVFLTVAEGMRRKVKGLMVPFAARAFTAWWYIMAAQALTLATWQLSGWAGFMDLRFFQALFVLSLLFAALQIWALGHFILYIWGGFQSRIGIPLAVFSAAYFLYFAFLLMPLQAGAQAGQWAIGFSLVGAIPYYEVLVTLFFLPFFTLLSAYYLLALRSRSEAKRVRVIVLGTAAALWNVTQVGQFATQGVADTPFMGVLVALNLVWALMLYVTYYPPNFLKRTFRMPSLVDEATV